VFHLLEKIELENFILFEKADFTFTSGLNAVSGETGAGKSLIARALGLGLGGRGGQDSIRAGCEEAKITVHFSKPDGKKAGMQRYRVDRVIRRDGGGRILLDGKPSTAQAVRALLSPLVDFAAQNEQIRLSESAYQLELLDAYGRLGPEAALYADLFRSGEVLDRRLKAGREEKALVRLRLEKAQEELASINNTGFNPATDLHLEDEIREMSSASHIVQAASEAVGLLEGGDPSVVDSVGHAKRTLDKMVEASPRLREASAHLVSALDSLSAALALASAAAEGAEADPDELDRLISRSETLKALGRKFACGVEGLAAFKEKLEREIAELSEWDAGEDEIRAKLAEILPKIAESGKALGEKRREAAKRLAKAVNRELAGLGMEQAGFSVEFEPLWHEGMPPEEILSAGSAGLEEATFFLSPNPGEAASSLADTASGGEASRAILAIKAALSSVYKPETMFLDEIDAGVGSRLGRELGDKLLDLSRSRQIIVITHLPQIAAYAKTHLKVAKKVKAGRTTAKVETLSGENRVDEIAKMIHGSSAGEVTMKQAREMLVEGGNYHG
jgi:ATPase involved in DNA repair